jgi:hypothetical protein
MSSSTCTLELRMLTFLGRLSWWSRLSLTRRRARPSAANCWRRCTSGRSYRCTTSHCRSNSWNRVINIYPEVLHLQLVDVHRFWLKQTNGLKLHKEMQMRQANTIRYRIFRRKRALVFSGPQILKKSMHICSTNNDGMDCKSSIPFCHLKYGKIKLL